MTSKDFKRRIEYFSIINGAAPYFSEFCSRYVESIYKVTVCLPDSSRCEFFTLHDFDLSPYKGFIHVYIDVYTRFDFKRELSFFQSFVSKCTDYQKMQLRHESRLFDLLKFCGYNVG